MNATNVTAQDQEKERGIREYYASRETDEERELKINSTACRIAINSMLGERTMSKKTCPCGRMGESLRELCPVCGEN
jgi:hypothetical protein